jgi:23S rRNA pseudouridine2605 synthase
MAEETQRIAKFMAAAGLCSRRDAERWIAAGRVAVNGNTLDTSATLVGDDDVVVVDGKTIKNKSLTPRVWRYHKPTGLVTTHHDPEGRPTVFEHLPPELPRVISVGRLDLDSEGLLLLTNSGTLSRALELPKNALERTYRVRIRGTPTDKHMHMISRGVHIDGMDYAPIDVVEETAKDGRNQWLTLTLREGKNREIRRIFEFFDYPVSRLIRTGYGGFELGNLKPEAVEEIPSADVARLMESLNIL